MVQLVYLNASSKLIWTTFIGNPSITWYFWTLIGIYLFIPVINPFIEKYGLKGCEYFLGIWFITIILKIIIGDTAITIMPLFAGLLTTYFSKELNFFKGIILGLLASIITLFCSLLLILVHSLGSVFVVVIA